MPKPCCSTTPSINQMGAFKESYSAFEFRAFSLRPGVKKIPQVVATLGSAQV